MLVIKFRKIIQKNTDSENDRPRQTKSEVFHDKEAEKESWNSI